MIEKIKLEVVGKVGYRRKVFEYFGNPLRDEVVIRIPLYFYKIRNRLNFFDSGEGSSLGITEFDDR